MAMAGQNMRRASLEKSTMPRKSKHHGTSVRVRVPATLAKQIGRAFPASRLLDGSIGQDEAEKLAFT